MSKTREVAANPAANLPSDRVPPTKTILEHYFK